MTLRAILAALVREYGRDLLRERTRVLGLLADRYPNGKRDWHRIGVAYQAGVVDALLRDGSENTRRWAVKQLVEEHSLAIDAAEEIVQALCAVLADEPLVDGFSSKPNAPPPVSLTNASTGNNVQNPAPHISTRLVKKERAKALSRIILGGLVFGLTVFLIENWKIFVHYKSISMLLSSWRHKDLLDDNAQDLAVPLKSDQIALIADAFQGSADMSQEVKSVPVEYSTQPQAPSTDDNGDIIVITRRVHVNTTTGRLMQLDPEDTFKLVPEHSTESFYATKSKFKSGLGYLMVPRDAAVRRCSVHTGDFKPIRVQTPKRGQCGTVDYVEINRLVQSHRLTGEFHWFDKGMTLNYGGFIDGKSLLGFTSNKDIVGNGNKPAYFLVPVASVTFWKGRQ